MMRMMKKGAEQMKKRESRGHCVLMGSRYSMLEQRRTIVNPPCGPASIVSRRRVRGPHMRNEIEILRRFHTTLYACSLQLPQIIESWGNEDVPNPLQTQKTKDLFTKRI
eukprot:scaffold3248_cov112-Cylindrotheca_fusiformis.AAC.4